MTQPPVKVDITMINDGVVEVIGGEVVELDYDGCLLKLSRELLIDTNFEMRIQNLDRETFEKFNSADARFEPGIEFQTRARVFSSYHDGMNPAAWITKVRYRGSIRIVRSAASRSGSAT